MSGKDHFEKDPFDPDAYEAFKRAVASRGSRPSIPNDAGIEAPEEIAERGRAMFRRALMQADADDLQEDLRQMLEALGMSDHARPYSPHRVFQEALNEMKRQLAAVPRSAATSATDLLAWLRDETSLELSFERWEEDGRWQVHEIRGGRNDQEWSLLGRGDTPEQALSAAKIALEVRKDAKAATRARHDRQTGGRAHDT